MCIYLYLNIIYTINEVITRVTKIRFTITLKGVRSSTGQTLDLLPRGHQLESHKPQDHWRVAWS